MLQTLLSLSLSLLLLSIQVFDKHEAPIIVEFVLQRYYQQFHLYKHVFVRSEKISLEQVSANEIQTPALARPLSHGVLLALQQ